MSNNNLPDGLISYGPNENCTLANCPLDASLFQYRPSVAANSLFLALFAVAGIAHTWRGIVYREFNFLTLMVLGCITEIIGYAGRLIMYNNPFSFDGFIIEIVCITIAPVFFCAAIYILLARVILHLDPKVSRLPLAFWYWFFIPFDVVSLALQAAGGAISSTSSGNSSSGVTISKAGLGLQVATLSLFIIGGVDYAIRYARLSQERRPLSRTFKIFLASTIVSIVLIYIRCCYRIYELEDGYQSSGGITNQGEFIALESCMITIAAFTLLGSNPGPVVPKLKEGKRLRAAEGMHGEKRPIPQTAESDASTVV